MGPFGTPKSQVSFLYYEDSVIDAVGKVTGDSTHSSHLNTLSSAQQNGTTGTKRRFQVPGTKLCSRPGSIHRCPPQENLPEAVRLQ
jgi:hypothetical protein